MELKKKVLIGFGWNAGAKFLGQLISWSVTIFVMRILQPGDYGLIGIATIFINFLMLLNELGLGAALIQKKDLEKDDLSKVFSILLFINISFFLMLFFAAPLLGNFFSEPQAIPIIRVLAIQFLLAPLACIPQSLLFRKMDFKKISIAEISSQFTGSAVVFILALNGAGVWALVWGNMCISLLKTIIIAIFSPVFVVPSFSIKGIAHFLSFGGYITMSSILWYISVRADSFIVGKFLGKNVLGAYNIAMEFASLPLDKVAGILNRVAFPAYSSIQNNLEDVRSYFLKSIRIISMIAFPVSWGMSSISHELIPVLLGDRWNQSIIPFQMLCFIIPFRLIGSLMSPISFGLGRPDLDFKTTLFASIVMPAGILIGIHWGILGISLAWVVAYPLVLLMYLDMIIRTIKLSWMSIWANFQMPLIFSAIMYFAVTAARSVMNANPKSLFHLFILVITGVIVYCSLFWNFYKNGCRELIALVRH